MYLTMHNSIRYTIQKNKKLVHDTIYDLTTIDKSEICQIYCLSWLIWAAFTFLTCSS